MELFQAILNVISMAACMASVGFVHRFSTRFVPYVRLQSRAPRERLRHSQVARACTALHFCVMRLRCLLPHRAWRQSTGSFTKSQRASIAFDFHSKPCVVKIMINRFQFDRIFQNISTSVPRIASSSSQHSTQAKV